MFKKIFLALGVCGVSLGVCAGSFILNKEDVIALYHLEGSSLPDYGRKDLIFTEDYTGNEGPSFVSGHWGLGVGPRDYAGALSTFFTGDIFNQTEPFTIDAWGIVSNAIGFDGTKYWYDAPFISVTITFDDGSSYTVYTGLANVEPEEYLGKLVYYCNEKNYLAPESASALGDHHVMLTFDRENLLLTMFVDGKKMEPAIVLPENVRRSVKQISLGNDLSYSGCWAVDEICIRKGIVETQDFTPNSVSYVIP